MQRENTEYFKHVEYKKLFGENPFRKGEVKLFRISEAFKSGKFVRAEPITHNNIR